MIGEDDGDDESRSRAVRFSESIVTTTLDTPEEEQEARFQAMKDRGRSRSRVSRSRRSPTPFVRRASNASSTASLESDGSTVGNEGVTDDHEGVDGDIDDNDGGSVVVLRNVTKARDIDENIEKEGRIGTESVAMNLRTEKNCDSKINSNEETFGVAKITIQDGEIGKGQQRPSHVSFGSCVMFVENTSAEVGLKGTDSGENACTPSRGRHGGNRRSRRDPTPFIPRRRVYDEDETDSDDERTGGRNSCDTPR